MIRYSIKMKLVSSIIITSSILTSLVVLINYYIEYNHDLNGIELKSKQIEKSILPSLTNSVWNLDLNGISTQLKGISALEDVLYVEIKENKSQIFSVGNPSSASKSKTLIKSYPLIQRVENENFNIGNIKIFFSLDNIQKRLLKKLIYFTAFQFLKTLLLTILFFAIFQHFLIQHIEKIISFLKAFNAESLSVNPLTLSRKNRASGDELDILCTSINALTERITKANLYKEQIIKKQEHEIIFKNTLQKNELFLKRFYNINSVFENETKNTFNLINNAITNLEKETSSTDNNITFLKNEFQRLQYLLAGGSFLAQYKNELHSKVTIDQIKEILSDLKINVANKVPGYIEQKNIILNIKRFTQFFELMNKDIENKVEIYQDLDSFKLKIKMKRGFDLQMMDLNSDKNQSTFLPFCSIIANEEGWKIKSEDDHLIITL